MRHALSAISLEHLLVRELELIGQIDAGSTEETFLLAKVRDFLSYWKGRAWQDTEAIEVAGAKLFLAAAPAVWASIAEMAEREFPPLSKYFLKFARSREPAALRLKPEAQIERAPTFALREFNSLAAEIEEGRVSEIASRILIANEAYQQSLTSERAINVYLSFLAKMLGRLSAKSTAAKPERAALLHRLSRDFLKWQPWDEKPWVFLMHGYHLEGAYREAESVIWEALRRFNSANIWRTLIIHLSRLSDRADDYHYYSRSAAEILPEDSSIISNRIRAILRKSDVEELPIACDLAGKMLSLDLRLKYQDELKTRLFLNAHVLLLQRGGDVRRFIDAYARSYLKTTNALHDLGWMARRFRCASQLGLMIVSRGLIEAPENGDLQDCAGLLKVIQAGSALDDAIEQADQMIERGTDSAATRNWLVRALVKRNAEGDRSAAREYLIVNIARFQDEESRAPLAMEESRSLLAMIEHERFDDIIAEVRSENREIDVSRIRGLGEEHWATPKARFSDSAPSQHPLPNDIWSLGTLKRISILLFDEPWTPRRATALSELDTMWREVGTYSNRNVRDYIELLVARADKEGAHEEELPAFAARFEYALNRSDRELLQQISREYPRLSALSLVARAMFGDKSAEAEIGRYLRMNAGLPAHEKPFHDELLRRTFEGSYPPADDTNIIDLFQRRRYMIEPLVRMANEALVYLSRAA